MIWVKLRGWWGDPRLFHWDQSKWCPYSCPLLHIPNIALVFSRSLPFIKQFFISIFSFDFYNKTMRCILQYSILQMRKLKLQEPLYLADMVALQVHPKHFNSESHTFPLSPIVCNPGLFMFYLEHFNHPIYLSNYTSNNIYIALTMF